MKCDTCIHRAEAGGNTWCDIHKTYAAGYVKNVDLGTGIPCCRFEEKPKPKKEEKTTDETL